MSSRWRAMWQKARRIVTIVAALAALVVVLMWLGGAFEDKLEARSVAPAVQTVGDREVLLVKSEPVDQIATAVGTIQPIQETVVGSRLLARVKAVHVNAADTVKKGHVLVELEDTDLQAALKEADAAVEAAESDLATDQRNFEKYRKLFEQGQAAPQEYDEYKRKFQVAKARLDAAKQSREVAATRLGYATVKCPLDGIVVDKQVDVGDMANPGQTLVKVYDPTRMQLIAIVPEGLTVGLTVGGTVNVRIQAIDKVCPARISQIVPEAQVGSRSFRVKVTGPCPQGVFPGMFGRMLIPVGTRREIWIPTSAIRRVGQLDMVKVVVPDQTPNPRDNPVERRFVRLGRRQEGKAEVVSGLAENDRILATF